MKKPAEYIKGWLADILRTDFNKNTKIRNSIDIDNKTYILNFSIINRKVDWTRGTSNKTKDNFFVPYFDYDRMKKSYVEEELKILQEQFQLGNILLFESSKNNYQAVGFSKLTLREFQEVLMHSSCDFAFIKFPKYLPYAKYYVLRQFSKGLTPKPKYLKTLKYCSDREQSYAHWKYFSILYPDTAINKLTNSDGLEYITIVDYPTGSNI
ncbi:hypothetical protein CMI43_03295 [Candidatus Pacearchaeota archaeon]|nr:hypothetical protein [Candidatus Pacearchaeota archaeon]|tara:strand:+ start:1836 stop:2465 length:630 start_codon:yes stop_codon:yes gene_type:complete